MHIHRFASVSIVCVAMACTPRRPLPPEQPLPPIAKAESTPPPPQPSCVRFWPEARYRSYAYDHVVHLESECVRSTSCNVSTNVNPAVIVVAIDPGQHLEVVTARGVNSSDFTPLVQCSAGTH